jgi:hypothetical protein
MTPVEQQFQGLKAKLTGALLTALPNGAHLIRVSRHTLPKGWNRAEADILFLAPPGYPGGQPDCFWVAPSGFRLEGGAQPQASNDSNPIPGVADVEPTTWFSWHLQSWNPNNDTLLTFWNVIIQRLHQLQ